jgi:hypothetical protein
MDRRFPRPQFAQPLDSRPSAPALDDVASRTLRPAPDPTSRCGTEELWAAARRLLPEALDALSKAGASQDEAVFIYLDAERAPGRQIAQAILERELPHERAQARLDELTRVGQTCGRVFAMGAMLSLPAASAVLATLAQDAETEAAVDRVREWLMDIVPRGRLRVVLIAGAEIEAGYAVTEEQVLN